MVFDRSTDKKETLGCLAVYLCRYLHVAKEGLIYQWTVTLQSTGRKPSLLGQVAAAVCDMTCPLFVTCNY